MTRILRLLLIAAIALPLWQPVAAQSIDNADYEAFRKSKSISINGKVANLSNKRDAGHSNTVSKAPSLKAGGGQIYDYYDKTVVSGSSTDEKLPITTSALGRTYSEGQMIYTSNQLGIQNGDQIVAIYFHATGTVAASENEDETNSIRLRLGKTTLTELTNSHPDMETRRASMDIVYEGALPTGSSWLKFELTEPYTYTGNNLLVDLQRISGNYAPTVTWYGEQQGNFLFPTYASYYYYSTGNGTNTSSNRSRFLPNMAIEYRRAHTGTVESRSIEVLKQSDLEAIPYTWKENGTGTEHSSNLGEVATDPDQMIAMIKEIYTNRSIPGNLKRGFAMDGSDNGETNQAVYYDGVGGIKFVGNSENGADFANKSNYEYEDIYGWGITGQIEDVQTSGYLANSLWNGRTYANYTYLNRQQYRPEKEGLTLLLVELKENYVDGSNSAIGEDETYGTEYQRLRAYFQNTIKSIRVVSEAKRTGEGFESGTLFKIDCDKMNKFFLLAKGQLHLVHNSSPLTDYLLSEYSNYVGTPNASNSYFCPGPGFMYFYLNDQDQGLGYTFLDFGGEAFLYHMFEQFSPSTTQATSGADDLYQNMINMESFPVIHDCLGVTYMNHQFLMYGADSKDADCQDVRDMMFFIPDYRMLRHGGRGADTEEYINYHPDLQPSVGMYVIRQNEITPTTEADDYYMLNLNWVTNLDDFLPGEYQEFELLQLVVDENDQETYVPVYYMNAQGQYTKADGVTPSDTPVPIKLHLGPGAEKNYPDVYVRRLSHGQQVTYAIRGRDKDPVTGESFLSLQTSNRQSYIVPGTDPTELVMLNNATYYSRFNPQTEKNCYSNKILVGNYIGGLTNNLVQGGTTDPTIFKFYRMLSDNDANPTLIGTAKVLQKTSSGIKLQITMSEEPDVQSPSSEYPYGSQTGLSKRAGYHTNMTEELTFPFYKDANNNYITDANGNKYIDFGKGFYVYDNFVEDLHKDNLPNRFFYKIELNTAENIKDKNGNNVGKTAHGNTFSIPVYRTKSDINGAFTIDEVNGDGGGNLQLPDAIYFDVDLQRGSKTELYRYATYRWMNTPANQRFILSLVDGDDETDEMPQGTAGNQDEYFTVSMNNVNEPEYYESHDVQVAATGYTKATFIDNLPIKKTSNPAAVYDYAPVIEWFASGFDATRRDYNTYGGPIQSTAVGKLELEVVEPTIIENGEAVPQVMSEYSWEANGNEYAYYNLYLKLKRTDANGIELPVVPEEYQFYKVRAWRQILKEDANGNLVPAPEYLGEQEKYANNEYIQARMGDEITTKYKLEEFTYPECVVDMSDNQAAMNKFEEFGSEDVEIEEGVTVKKGTFGALKSGEGSEVEFTVRFIVRIYFAPQNVVNAAEALNGSKAPEDEIKNFYVVEAVKDYKIDSDVPTAINTIYDTNREVVGVKYYNTLGIESDRPFDGVNIVVTRYSDGSTTSTKILK